MNVKFLLHLFLLCCLNVLLSSFIFPLDRNRTLTQLHHTAWTAKDGAPSQIGAIAQTTDGYIWLGSTQGLFKFDGVEFTRFEAPAGTSLPGFNVISLLATNDSGLWVTYRPSGLAFIKDGKVQTFSAPDELPEAEVFEVAADAAGRIWAGTLTGLALFDGKGWIEIGEDWNLQNARVWSMFTDRDGTFWVSIGDTVVYLPLGSRSFQKTGEKTIGIPQMAQAKDGRLWRSEWDRPIRPIALGDDDAAKDPNTGIDGYGLLFDRDGSLWMIGAKIEGLKRIRYPENLGDRHLGKDASEIESFTPRDGLTDFTTGRILEDREGNIWITSNRGLDRFSLRRLVSVRLPPTYTKFNLLAGDDGDIWVSTTTRNPLLRISGEKLIPESEPVEVTSVYREPGGPVWWGGLGGIWKQDGGRLEFFGHPDGYGNWFWEVTSAGILGGVWARLGDHGLVHFKDGAWTNSERPVGLPEKGPSASYQDAEGRVWFGYSSGDLFVIDREQVGSFSRDTGLDIGRIKVIRGRGDRIWVGGDSGFAFLKDGRFQTVTTSTEAFGSIAGIVETADGALWLNELNGIVYISPEERRRLVEDPVYRVNYQRYGIQDGMPGAPQMNHTVSTAVEGSDGRIWFATDNGLVWVDPKHQQMNTLPPPVLVKTLTTDDRSYGPGESLELPRGTESLRISYTALSLSVPESTQFKYRLEGIDKDWWDAGTRREASFTNLGPGRYRFRVIAANSDGVWNNEGATLEFTILPMFYQTTWFFALCVAIFAVLVWLAHKARLRQVKNVMQLQFQERLAERTRIAQDLHDTLLQGFVGAKMQLFAELLDLPAGTAKAKRLKSVYDLIGELIEEGRTKVGNLREAEYLDVKSIESHFMKIADEFDARKKIALKMIVVGTPQPLHPLIGTDLLQIGTEALVNAFLHSGATTIEIEVEYGSAALNLSVRDDGRGIESEILSSGRDGHWGLTGMRERAKKIKAELRIWSRANAGTEVVISVPRRFAFRDTGVVPRWVRRFVRTDNETTDRDSASPRGTSSRLGR